MASRKAYEAAWLEPVAAMGLFGFTLFINRMEPWPWIWVIDLIACLGAAVSRRSPATGAALTGISLAVWLPFPGTLSSVSGVAFYINIFAAVRMDLRWKVPLALGLGGLAYLTLVRNSVVDSSYRWSTSIFLLMVLAMAWGGGAALRHAARGIQLEQENSKERLQDLQVSLARELHDSVAQTLSSAAMRANIVMGDPALSPLAVDQLERIADECRSSAHDLRQLLSALRDEPERAVPPGPLADVESLRRTAEAQAERLRREGFTVDVNIDVTKLSAARCQTLAAITVEATNNIVKHALPGTACTFSIEQGTEDVVGNFSNVRQYSRAARRGFGLTGVQERLTLLNGTSKALVKDGRWILHVRLPLGLASNLSPPSPVPPPDSMFSEQLSS